MTHMTQYIYRLLLTLLLLLPAAMGHANNTAPQFLSLIPDLPLMPGMVELEEQNLIFDKADGRIIESHLLLDNATATDAQKFYNDTLPQFGWKTLGNSAYQRGNETITFHYEQENQTLLMSLIMKSSR